METLINLKIRNKEETDEFGCLLKRHHEFRVHKSIFATYPGEGLWVESNLPEVERNYLHHDFYKPEVVH